MSKSIVEMVRENQTEPWYDSKTSKVTPGVVKKSDHSSDLIDVVNVVLHDHEFKVHVMVTDRYVDGLQYKWYNPNYQRGKEDRDNIIHQLRGLFEFANIPYTSIDWVVMPGPAEYASNGAPALIIKVAGPVKEKAVPLPGSKIGKWIKNEVTRRWEYVEQVVA
jgi:hypothetical protein